MEKRHSRPFTAKILDDRVYIVFDGTSYYMLYGIDVKEEMEADENVEPVAGPFGSFNSEVETLCDYCNMIAEQGVAAEKNIPWKDIAKVNEIVNRPPYKRE